MAARPPWSIRSRAPRVWPPTRFGGSELPDKVLAAVAAAAPLVLVSGPPGVGKSRVAIDAIAELQGNASQFPVLYVDARAEPLDRAVSTAAALCADRGHAGPPKLVALLDNVDADVDGALAVGGEIARLAPEATVILTSAVLPEHCGGQLVSVSPLGTEAARALFVHMVQLLCDGPAPPDRELESLLGFLDGVPAVLAIAAERLRETSAAELVAELDASRSCSLLERVQPARRAWSLLPHELQRVLAALSVLSDGFDGDLASAVCRLQPAEMRARLARLVRRGLVAIDSSGGGPRWRTLAHIRAVSRTELGADERQEAVSGAARRVAQQVRRLEARLWSHEEAASREQFAHNARSWASVLSLAIDDCAEVVRNALLAGPDLWIEHGSAPLVATWCDRLLDGGAGEGPLLALRAELACNLRQPDTARALASEVRRRDGDAAWLRAVYCLAFAQFQCGARVEALETVDRSLAEPGVDDRSPAALRLRCYGVQLALYGEGPEECLRRAGDVWRDGLPPRRFQAALHLSEGWAAMRLERDEAASSALGRSAELYGALGLLRLQVFALALRGELHHVAGRWSAAASDYRRAAELERRLGLEASVHEVNLALVAHAEGRIDEAVRDLRRAYEGRLGAGGPAADFVGAHLAFAIARRHRLSEALSIWRPGQERRDKDAARTPELAAAEVVSVGIDVVRSLRRLETGRPLARGLELASLERRLGGAGDGGPDSRIAARLVRHVLDELRDQMARSQPLLEVQPDGRRYRLDGRTVDLGSKHVLRRLLIALASAEAPLGDDAICTRCWPDETILPEAARMRIWTAVKRLRDTGLTERLLREADGYALVGPVAFAPDLRPAAANAR